MSSPFASTSVSSSPTEASSPSSSPSSSSASASAVASSSSSSSSSSTSPSSSSSSSSTSSSATPPYFPSHAIDHAFAGIAAGAAATVCMNPLDLIKTKFQVDTTKPRAFGFRSAPAEAAAAALSSMDKGKGRALPLADSVGSSSSGVRRAACSKRWRYYALGGKVGHDMVGALNDIVRTDGWKGLYRGLSPNVVGNSASWGLYFLWYTMIKDYMAADLPTGLDGDGQKRQLSAGQHLLAASESGAVTALMTNPIWVVKTRMFTTPASSAGSGSSIAKAATAGARNGVPEVYRGLWHGLTSIWRNEGIRGLYKGAGLALFGVSNGAIQFMAYEELKKWRTSVAVRKMRAAGETYKSDGDKIMLSNVEYIVMSGTSKVAAILLTYPYQVIRSRIQNHATSHLYPNIPTCIRLTYTQEGVRAFYKGLVPNLVRILPGTCVTFVVYENVSWGLRGLSQRRDRKRDMWTREQQGEGGAAVES